MVGEEEVENLEEKQFHLEVEEILEENQFSSIVSTLTCPSTNLKNFTKMFSLVSLGFSRDLHSGFRRALSAY